MEHEDNGQSATDNGHRGAGTNQYDDQEAQPGTTHSIRPGVLCPETVLVARMTDGSYLLMAHPQREPAAFLARADADALQQALQEAFGNPADVAVSTNGKHTGTELPGREAPRSEQAQS